MTFERDGFYATLRSKIYKEFSKTDNKVMNLGPPTLTKVFADLMLLISMTLTLVAGSYTATDQKLAIGVTIATGLFNGLFIGIGHNFMHQKDNFRRHYMDISGAR